MSEDEQQGSGSQDEQEDSGASENSGASGDHESGGPSSSGDSSLDRPDDIVEDVRSGDRQEPEQR